MYKRILSSFCEIYENAFSASDDTLTRNSPDRLKFKSTIWEYRKWLLTLGAVFRNKMAILS